MVLRFVVQQPDCLLNKVFLGIHTGLCVFSVLLNLFPRVVRVTGGIRIGLLQTGALLCYVTVLTFSGIASQPVKTLTRRDEQGKILQWWS